MKKFLAVFCLLLFISSTANAVTIEKSIVVNDLTFSVAVDWPEYTTFDVTLQVNESGKDEETGKPKYLLKWVANGAGGKFSQSFAYGSDCTKKQERVIKHDQKGATVTILGQQQSAHPFTEWKYFDETKHIRWCPSGMCRVKEKASHEGGIATCTEGAICTGCGTAYGDPAEDNHLWSENYVSNGDGTHSLVCVRNAAHKNTRIDCFGGMATCTKKAVCAECCAEYGAVDKNNHVNEVILPAVAPTETECGWTEGLKCGDCGEIIIPQQPIPVLPKTGDRMNFALLAVLAAAGMIGMTVLLRRKQKA